MRSPLRPDFQPIPAGYHAIIATWLESPEEFLSATRIQFRVKQPAYMHLDRMCQDGLLEEDSPGYRPQKKDGLSFMIMRRSTNFLNEITLTHLTQGIVPTGGSHN